MCKLQACCLGGHAGLMNVHDESNKAFTTHYQVCYSLRTAYALLLQRPHVRAAISHEMALCCNQETRSARGD
jgi:hypothetical protein